MKPHQLIDTRRAPRQRRDDVDHYTNSAVPSGSPTPRPAASRGSFEILEKLQAAITAVDAVNSAYWDEMADCDPVTPEFKRINAKIMTTLESGKGLRELRNEKLREALS